MSEPQKAPAQKEGSSLFSRDQNEMVPDTFVSPQTILRQGFFNAGSRLTPNNVIQLQRLLGNKSVSSLLQQQRASQGAGEARSNVEGYVQREGEAAPAAHAHEEQAARRALHRHFTGIDATQLIAWANALNEDFEAETTATRRGQIARILVALYHAVERLISQAASEQVDPLPQVDGIVWNSSSPLAGLPEDIPVFNWLDVWTAALPDPAPVRRAQRRPPPPPVQTETEHTDPHHDSVIPPDVHPAEIRPDMPPPTSTERASQFVERTGQALDVGGFLIDFALLFVESVAAEFVGLAMAVLGGPLNLAGAWLQGDALAEWNGYFPGYWNAIGDMADTFRNRDLEHTPLAQWPAIPHPAPHNEGLATLVSGQAWNRGEQTGNNAAYNWARRFHRQHTMQDVNGQTRQVDINGQMMLYILYRQYGSVTTQVMRAQIMRQLEARGTQWPRRR